MKILNYFKKNSWWRWLPLLILIILFSLFFYFGLYNYLTYSALKENREVLVAWTASHYFTMVTCFIISYTLAVALSIPGAAFFTIAGGFLFGLWWGSLFVISSAILGSTIIFEVVRFIPINWLEKKVHPKMEKIRKGFHKNAFIYLLILRILPFFPFWLINIVSALLNVPLKTFILATGLGIIPGTLIYVTLGQGLNFVLGQDKPPDLSMIFSPPILLSLCGLALLTATPIFYRYFEDKKKK